MRFVDLFSGLGGFHVALRKLGCECVFASEIDPLLQELYEQNFGLRPTGDIRSIPAGTVPGHDILCAGFPCQTFSKAGDQSGLGDRERGQLFYNIVEIVEEKKPKFVILENVPNIEKHDSGKTWMRMLALLGAKGYETTSAILSPHQFGVPHFRQRFFAVAAKDGLGSFRWPAPGIHETSIRDILDVNPQCAKMLSPQLHQCIGVWQDFLDRFPSSEELPSFPIWSMEFGASYPYESATPFGLGLDNIRQFTGAYGTPLAGLSEREIAAALPSHALREQELFPRWKRTFIRQNRELYALHRAWIGKWLPSVLPFSSSMRKFEWNAKGEERILNRMVLQVRASGIRAKRATSSPSLVAMTSTQVPIITWEKRYMTPRECARLQSLPDELALPTSPNRAFEALGNGVNAKIVQLIAERLLCPLPDPQVSDSADYQLGLMLPYNDKSQHPVPTRHRASS